MKYKNLKSFAHNHVHSFVSYMNYFDSGYVIDDILAAARSPHDGPLLIHWIPELDSNVEFQARRVYKSIEHYRNALPAHAARHGLDLGIIKEFRMEIYRMSSHQIRIDSLLIDDRGKKYRQAVSYS